MSKPSTKLILPLMSLIMGSLMVAENGTINEEDKVVPRPKGHDHRVRSEEEKAIKKAHKKSLKAKRNARKGIYEHKFVYKKGSKKKEVINNGNE